MIVARRRAIVTLALLVVSQASATIGQEKETVLAPAPITIHPENPHYFVFRGKPLVLVAATEHYGSVINRRFDFERYLRDAADKKQTVTRLFLLFRELQNARNPASPAKPESPDYLAPYARVGPGKALDGEPVYDLDRWNTEYFDRLHKFFARASALGIVVEVTLFSNTYSESVWALNPLRHLNNVQSVGKVDWPEYNTLKDKALVERQLAYVRKVVRETSGFDNLYYEICNEPGGGLAGHATPAEVDAWQDEVGRTLRAELKQHGRTHLVFGSEAFSYTPVFTQGLDASFAGARADVVNVHPLPNTVLGGRAYMLGNFMSKELTLAELRDFCAAAWKERKPCVLDEDNAASLYRDDVGWTIHRKRAWTSVIGGAHYDFIDFSITVGSEAGTPESRRKLRTWMRHLSEFIHSFDFIHAKPAPEWIEAKPDHVVCSALVDAGNDYVAYLADGREITDPAAGAPIGGSLAFRLPEGTYQVRFYGPTTGEYSPGVLIKGGERASVELAPFRQDVVLRATRVHDSM